MAKQCDGRRNTDASLCVLILAFSCCAHQAASTVCPASSCYFVAGDKTDACTPPCFCRIGDVCSFSRVEDAVAAAVNSTMSAPSCPAVVYVCPGLHYLAEEILIRDVTASIQLIGIGGNTTLVAASNSRILRVDTRLANASVQLLVSGLIFSQGSMDVGLAQGPDHGNGSAAIMGGGCLALSGPLSVVIANSTFSNCSVSQRDTNTVPAGGGAVFIGEAVRAEFRNCRFVGNRLNAVSIRPVKLKFLNTVARIPGSAVHVNTSGGTPGARRAEVQFTDCTFEGNNVTGNGSSSTCGNIYIHQMNRSDTAQHVFVVGGALALTGRSSVVIDGNTTFSQNYDVVCPQSAWSQRWPLDANVDQAHGHVAGEHGNWKLEACVAGSTVLRHLAIVEGHVSLLCRNSSPLYSGAGQHCPAANTTNCTDPGNDPSLPAQVNLTTLLLLGRYADLRIPADLSIRQLFIWLGGSLSIGTSLTVDGFTLAASVQPNINLLTRLSPSGTVTRREDINFYCHHYVILEGVFLIYARTVNLFNHAYQLTIRPHFQVINIYFMRIFNYGGILSMGTFPLLESYVQTSRGFLYFQVPSDSSCYLEPKPLSRLHNFTLSGVVGLYFGETNCSKCRIYSDLVNSTKQAEFLLAQSPAKPTIVGSLHGSPPKYGLHIAIRLAIVASGSNADVSSPVLYNLTATVTDVYCEALTNCGCEICRSNKYQRCAWYSNVTSTAATQSCMTSLTGLCSKASAQPKDISGQLYYTLPSSNAVYTSRSVHTCCPNDCSGRRGAACTADFSCDCGWYWTQESDCRHYASHVWIAVGLGSAGVLLLFVASIAALRAYQRKKSRMASLSQWQAATCSLWLRDAEEIIKASQVFPAAFLITAEEIELMNEIGSGGFGRVYAAKLRETTTVAVKKILDFTVQDGEELQQFRHEASMMCSLHHPNIVQLMGIALDGDSVLIVMEYLAKGSVRDLLQDASFNMDWKLRVSMAIDTARGMIYLHGKNPPVIHRDLKTHNLLVSSKLTVKIADFGVTKFIYRSIQHEIERQKRESGMLLDEADGANGIGSSGRSFSGSGFSMLDRDELTQQLLGSESRKGLLSVSNSLGVSISSAAHAEALSPRVSGDMTKHTTWVGTAHWCAPELLVEGSMRAAYDKSVDVYAFGLILWSLVTGLSPFKEYRFHMELMDAVRSGKRPEIPEECPSAYRQLLEKCWSPQPRYRPLFPAIATALEDMNKFYQ